MTRRACVTWDALLDGGAIDVTENVANTVTVLCATNLMARVYMAVLMAIKEYLALKVRLSM